MHRFRSYLLAAITLFLVHFVHAQELVQDSLSQYPSVKAIISADDLGSFPPEYAFFIESFKKNRFSQETKTNFDF